MAAPLGDAVIRVLARVDNAIQGLGKVRDSLNRFTKNATVANRSAANIGAQLTTLGNRAKAAATSMRAASFQATLFGAALLGALTPAVIAGAKFEQTMAGVRAVVADLNEGTRESVKRFAELNETAKELGRTTVFTASQAAEAIQFLGLAGFTTDEILKTVGETLNLAAAGMIDLGRAAEISADTLRAFNLAAEDLNRVTDALAATAANANTNILQMSEALKFAAPLAASLGQRVEDLTVAIGLLANAGIKGSIAGTNLAQVFSQLTKKGESTNKTLRKYGLTFADVNPEVVSIIDILGKFRDANVSTADTMRLFGIRGGRAMLILKNTTKEAVDSLVDQLENKFGVAAEQAAIKIDTVSGAFIEFKSRAEGVFIAAFEAIKDSIRGFLAEVTRALESIITWIEDNEELVATIIKVTAVVGGLSVAIGGLGLAVSGVVGVFGLISGGLGALVTGAGAAVTAVGVLGNTIISSFSATSVAAVASAATTTAVFTGAAATITREFFNTSVVTATVFAGMAKASVVAAGSITTSFVTAARAITTSFTRAALTTITAFAAMSTAAVASSRAITTAFAGASASLVATSTGFATLTTTATSAGQALLGFTMIATSGTAAATGLGTAAGTAGTALGGLLSVVTGFIVVLVAIAAITALVLAFAAAWDEVSSALSAAADIFTPFMEGLKEGVANVFGFLKETFDVLTAVVIVAAGEFEKLFKLLDQLLNPVLEVLGIILADTVIAALTIVVGVVVVLTAAVAGLVKIINFAIDSFIEFGRWAGFISDEVKTSTELMLEAEEAAKKQAEALEKATEAARDWIEATRDQSKELGRRVSEEQELIGLLEKVDSLNVQQLNRLAELLEGREDLNDSLVETLRRVEAEIKATEIEIETVDKASEEFKELRLRLIRLNKERDVAKTSIERERTEQEAGNKVLEGGIGTVREMTAAKIEQEKAIKAVEEALKREKTVEEAVARLRSEVELESLEGINRELEVLRRQTEERTKLLDERIATDLKRAEEAQEIRANLVENADEKARVLLDENLASILKTLEDDKALRANLVKNSEAERKDIIGKNVKAIRRIEREGQLDAAMRQKDFDRQFQLEEKTLREDRLKDKRKFERLLLDEILNSEEKQRVILQRALKGRLTVFGDETDAKVNALRTEVDEREKQERERVEKEKDESKSRVEDIKKEVRDFVDLRSKQRDQEFKIVKGMTARRIKGILKERKAFNAMTQVFASALLDRLRLETEIDSVQKGAIDNLARQVKSIQDLIILNNVLTRQQKERESAAFRAVQLQVRREALVDRLRAKIATDPENKALQERLVLQERLKVLDQASLDAKLAAAGLEARPVDEPPIDVEAVAIMKVELNKLVATVSQFKGGVSEALAGTNQVFANAATSWVKSATDAWVAAAPNLLNAVRSTVARLKDEFDPDLRRSPSFQDRIDMQVGVFQRGIQRMGEIAQSAPSLSPAVAAGAPGMDVGGFRPTAVQPRQLVDNRRVDLNLNSNVDLEEVTRHIGRALTRVSMDSNDI